MHEDKKVWSVWKSTSSCNKASSQNATLRGMRKELERQENHDKHVHPMDMFEVFFFFLKEMGR